MIQAKEAILDRVEQSFILLKNNFLPLVSALLIFNLLTGVLLSNLFYFSFLNSVDIGTLSNNFQESFSAIYNSTSFQLYFAFGIIGLFLVLILYIPVFLGTIKSIQQCFHGEDPTPKENIIYGFKNLVNSFRVYWYVFAYIALIPCIAIIISLLIILYGINLGGNITQLNTIIIVGIILLLLSFLYLGIMSIIRGVKSHFAMYAAVEKNDYQKNNFEESIQLTKGKWFRIFGNLFLIGLMVALCLGMITNITNIVTGLLASSGLNSVSIGDINDKNIGVVLEELSKFNIFTFIGNIISTSLASIGKVFVFVFTYIFYQRLRYESNQTDLSLKKEEEL